MSLSIYCNVSAKRPYVKSVISYATFVLSITIDACITMISPGLTKNNEQVSRPLLACYMSNHFFLGYNERYLFVVQFLILGSDAVE